MRNRRNRRTSTEVNAGSMADIAFLLLIFFLVTTTIVEDKGVFVRLPPWEDNPPITNLSKKNVFQVFINADNELLIRGEVLAIANLKSEVKLFISNPNKSKELPQKPSKAVVSLCSDRGTSYTTYLSVYNELKRAYRELRDEEAQRRFQELFSHCSVHQRKEIKDYIPLVISESESTDFGDFTSN